MKMKRGWFRLSSGLALSLLCLAILPACSRPFIEVNVGAKCEAEGDKPTGSSRLQKCDRNPDNSCMQRPNPCECRS